MAVHFEAVVGRGVCVVGNGRSVLGCGAGEAVDAFEHVVRVGVAVVLYCHIDWDPPPLKHAVKSEQFYI